MKTPIEVKDIRKGDLIRWESGELAHEFRTSVDEHGWELGLGQHYLLERPTPPVELPTEPTLGIVTIGNSYGKSGNAVGATVDGDSVRDSLTGEYYSTTVITAFTPAVAVPASALDELRRRAEAGQFNSMLGEDVLTFLAAVDAANGDAS